MSASSRPYTILCNGAALAKGRRTRRANVLSLDYRGTDAKVKLHLPDFVLDVNYLPDRVLDLLEIAAYVFAADRSIGRGDRDAVEFHSWSRSLRFLVRVRDHSFWRRPSVQDKLAAALKFMSGDRCYEFDFQPGHSTPATGLFDREGFSITPDPRARAVLFSGGLDSLAGAVDLLSDPSTHLYLVSHQSQSGTTRTQNKLVEALDRLHPGRCQHYRFRCSLQGERAEEETQRTRAFLYASTAFALAQALRSKTALAYENGVTAINFPRRADLLNARASRTTHPKAMALTQAFLSEVLGEPFTIGTPFIWKTKTDVVQLLAERGGTDLITSSVSCSKTFQKLGQASHCGGCSQCIDRRFAAYATSLHGIDNSGIYARDFLAEPIEDLTTRTTLIDYVRQAKRFAEWNVDCFCREQMAELVDVVDYVGLGEDEAVQAVHDLCQRHGNQVAAAIRRMREVHDDPYRPVPAGSFLRIVGDRDYLGDAQYDCAKLSSDLAALPSGDQHASAFEKLAKDVLEAIFHPDLTNPRSQVQMDQGRKRIDITFDNNARDGFFARLRDAHQKHCPWVVFECKNYTGALGNPEFDQLMGRLGNGRPEVGFIVCRKTKDPTAALRHCQDRSSGRKGETIVMVLEDGDLCHLLQLKARGQMEAMTSFLEERLRQILLRA
jgi:7-cyano-7-deazaguanine synthase in queuosine biosynthesis